LVKVVPDEAGALATYYGAEVGFAGLANAFDAFEGAEQLLDGFGAYAGYFFQLAADGAFGAAFAVVGDAEAVGFVPEALDYFEGFGALVEVEGVGIAGEIKLFEALGDAEDGDAAAQAEGFQGFEGGAELAFAAVDDDGLGEGGVLVEEAAVAAVDGLGHAGVVVGAFHGLDIEVAVVLFTGLAVFEYHAGAYGVGALDVAIVKALDVAGLFVEAEVFLHLGHEALHVAVGVYDLDVFELFHAVVAAVFEAKLYEVLLVASLGQMHFYAGDFQIYFVGEVKGAGIALKALAELGDGQGEELFGAFVELFLELQGMRLQDPAVDYFQEIDVTILGIGVDAVDVYVGNAGVYDGAFGLVAVYGLVAFFDFLGIFEAEVLGGSLHFLLEVALYGVEIALNEVTSGFDVFVVILLGLEVYAGGFAVADVVFEAGAKLAGADIFFAEVELAGADVVGLADEAEDGFHDLNGGVGAVVLGTVFNGVTGGEDAGEALFLDADPGIGFVVFEVDVVAGLVLFDEVVFQQEGIEFGFGDDGFDIGHLTGHHVNACAVVAFGEVRAHALLEVFGLAYVEYAAVRIQVLVYAGLVGEAFEEVADLFAGHATNLACVGERGVSLLG